MLAPHSPVMPVCRAYALMQLHRSVQTNQILHQCIYIVKYYLLCVCRFEEAEADCTSAIELDKKHVDAYCRRANVRVMLCKLEEAKLGIYYAF